MRDKILSFLDHPVDAIELTKKYKVNKTSVYRQIEVLLGIKLIKEVDFGDGKKRYERVDLGHHHHLVCDSCKSVSDVTMEKDLEAVEKKIKKLKGFKVQRHSLEFFGLCKKCVAK